MKKEELKKLEIYCPNETCGDPVPGYYGGINSPRTKRRMTFSGFDFWDTSIYLCPVCGKKRKFAATILGDGYKEVS